MKKGSLAILGQDEPFMHEHSDNAVIFGILKALYDQHKQYLSGNL